MIDLVKEARVASFNAILPRATEAMLDSKVAIVIIWSPFYVDEFDEGQHVYCPQIAVDILHPKPKRAFIDWEIDATIHPDGSMIYNPEVCVARL